MRALPWILVGVGIGAVITVLVANSEPEYATGYDGVEDAARKTYGWGTKKRVEGKAGSVMGAVKEGFGRLTADDDLADEGAAERVVGKVKDAVGEFGHAAGQTIHDLNK